MRFPLATTLVLLALETSAVAQTKFCIAGNLDDLTPAQISSCQAKSSGLKAEARLHGTPDNWHFVVVCDEAGWDAYASFAGNNVKEIKAAAENTDRALRFTFVRGSSLEEGNTHDLDLVLASVNKDMPGTQVVRPIPSARPATPRPMLTASRLVPPGPEKR